ncbi:MAG: 5'-nucleotidase SurE [Chlamydiales bacterium]|nr:5'-nucleotidase SurE [Chlamydiales bacterium]MCH9634868.1 5'-nucleotidase SurE [Chlamydiales bacterium]
MDQTKQKRPLLLLTNDDGLYAPGISTLWKAIAEADFADIAIVAPTVERSGCGVSITWDRPIHIQKVEWENGIPAWAIDGAPADCVKLGVRILLDREPDLIVSGINAGSNAGRNVLHSGTIGAVVEGLFQGIPGIALSCEDGKKPNFHVARKYVADVIRYVLEQPQPEGTFLNVNFPHAAQEEVKGFKLTRQGKGRWSEQPKMHRDHEEGSSWWIGGKPQELDEDKDCDIAWMRQGYMVATPLHMHELTDHAVFEKRKESFENYFIAENRAKQ